jgi:hypothetical protein
MVTDARDAAILADPILAGWLVRDACVASGVALYSTMREHDWRELYALGVRSSSVTAQADRFIADLRALAGRTMPW